jgi:DNA-directed RNA polymerase subunit RPC12/RpoP
MKVKCVKCGRKVDRVKQTLEVYVKKHELDMVKYLESYVCGSCKKETIDVSNGSKEGVENTGVEKKVTYQCDYCKKIKESIWKRSDRKELVNICDTCASDMSIPSSVLQKIAERIG